MRRSEDVIPLLDLRGSLVPECDTPRSTSTGRRHGPRCGGRCALARRQDAPNAQASHTTRES
eukprot:2347485-Prymnesium_polylepis.2